MAFFFSRYVSAGFAGTHQPLVNLSVEFADDTQTETIEATIADMDSELKTEFPIIKRLFVEAKARKKVGLVLVSRDQMAQIFKYLRSVSLDFHVSSLTLERDTANR